MKKTPKRMMGIDWGTSRTYPAILDEDGTCQSLLPSDNSLCNGGIPSLFSYSSIYGESLCEDVLAEELEIYAPQSVVSSVKMRLAEEEIVLEGKNFSGVEIASKVIRHQMEHAVSELDVQGLEADREKVVVCAPVSFGTTERLRIKQAFEMAGYQVARILAEPVAAAVFYGKKGNILVLDIGAGTTDVALVRDNPLISRKNPYPYINLDSTGVAVAGDMFDEALADYLITRFEKELPDMKIKAFRDKKGTSYRKLVAAARKAKETLSRKNDIGLTYSDHEAGSGRLRVSRSELNHAIMPLVDQIIRCVEDLLFRNGLLDRDDFEIIMTGGSSYVPVVRERLKQLCTALPEGKINIKSPEKAIGFGAAIYAANMGLIQPKVDFSYGVGVYVDDVLVIDLLIPAGVELPCSVEKDYYTRYPDQTSVKVELYESQGDARQIPMDERKRLKCAPAVHNFGQKVPKDTPCHVKYTLTEDGILELELTSKFSKQVGTTSCSVFRETRQG